MLQSCGFYDWDKRKIRTFQTKEAFFEKLPTDGTKRQLSSICMQTSLSIKHNIEHRSIIRCQ